MCTDGFADVGLGCLNDQYVEYIVLFLYVLCCTVIHLKLHLI